MIGVPLSIPNVSNKMIGPFLRLRSFGPSQSKYMKHFSKMNEITCFYSNLGPSDERCMYFQLIDTLVLGFLGSLVAERRRYLAGSNVRT